MLALIGSAIFYFRHGTRCAGEVSSEANNTACTIGIAPDSKIGGEK